LLFPHTGSYDDAKQKETRAGDGSQLESVDCDSADDVQLSRERRKKTFHDEEFWTVNVVSKKRKTQSAVCSSDPSARVDMPIVPPGLLSGSGGLSRPSMYLFHVYMAVHVAASYVSTQ
jgi:hypothetical protein